MSRTIIKRIEIKPLTEEQKLRLKQLNDLPDSEIDTSDAPELPSIGSVAKRANFTSEQNHLLRHG
ncbi:hypothetical protein AB6G29_23675 [Providencia hangzhouensis]|uniref:hypothetical protein n=1 Tax=Providencia hangzhouensis TaxID=3031799 RepID=UPI0034DD3335